MLTNIKVIKFGDLTENHQDEFCISTWRDPKFGDYIPWILSYTEDPTSLDALLILFGAAPGDTVLVHYVW